MLKYVKSVGKYLVIPYICLSLISSFFTKPYSYQAEDLKPMASERKPYSNSLRKSILHLHDSKGNFFCTAFVIDDKYALTAAHCLDFNIGKNIIIKDDLDRETDIIATVAAYSSRRDLGMIQGDFSSFNHTPIDHESAKAAYSKILLTCGFPSGQKKMLCTPFLVKGPSNFFVEGVMNAGYPGMSGGPVMTLDGIAVGVVSGVSKEVSLIAPLTGVLGGFKVEPEQK